MKTERKEKTFEVTRQGRRSGHKQVDVVRVERKAEAKKAAQRQSFFRGPWGSEAVTVVSVVEVAAWMGR